MRTRNYLFILVENKDQVKSHISKDEDKAMDFAVDGIKHYLSFFTTEKLSKNEESIRVYFNDWKIRHCSFWRY